MALPEASKIRPTNVNSTFDYYLKKLKNHICYINEYYYKSLSKIIRESESTKNCLFLYRIHKRNT